MDIKDLVLPQVVNTLIKKHNRLFQGDLRKTIGVVILTSLIQHIFMKLPQVYLIKILVDVFRINIAMKNSLKTIQSVLMQIVHTVQNKM